MRIVADLPGRDLLLARCAPQNSALRAAAALNSARFGVLDTKHRFLRRAADEWGLAPRNCANKRLTGYVASGVFYRFPPGIDKSVINGGFGDAALVPNEDVRAVPDAVDIYRVNMHYPDNYVVGRISLGSQVRSLARMGIPQAFFAVPFVGRGTRRISDDTLNALSASTGATVVRDSSGEVTVTLRNPSPEAVDLTADALTRCINGSNALARLLIRIGLGS